jgi:hypothetical protein
MGILAKADNLTIIIIVTDPADVLHTLPAACNCGPRLLASNYLYIARVNTFM